MDERIHDKAQSDLAFFRSILPQAEAQGAVNLDIPGPFSRFERTLAYHFARDRFKGHGHFVELGSFLGASTQAFAAGLKDNSEVGEARKIIHTYDLFKFIGNWDTAYQSKMLEGEAKNDFLGKFRENISGFEQYVQIHHGDILQAKPPQDGRPIEILFVDLCKTEDIMLYVAEHFFPRLSVGSVYMQQDYLFPGLPFIKAFHEIIWDYFEIERVLPPTIVFRLRKPFDLAGVDLPRYRDRPRAEKLELIRANAARFGEPYAALFEKSYELRSHSGWRPEPAAPKSA